MDNGFGASELLGWSADTLAELERSRGWTEQAIERLELGWRDHEQRVVIPIRDATLEDRGELRYDPTGKRKPKMLADEGIPRDLFPPPEAIGDIEDRQPWLVEGEPDAIRLWSLGLPAIAVPGANNWHSEWASRFSGRHWEIAVCFDCDPTGRANAPRAATDLTNAGITTRLIDLDPSRNDGYDLTDWARAATSPELRAQAADALRAIATATAPYQPPRKPWQPINLANLEPRPPTLPTIGGANLIYPGKRHVFSGPPEAAKTLAAYAIALQEVRLGGTILLIDFEMGAWDARDRLREMGADDSDLAQFLYVEPETPADEDIIETLAETTKTSLVIIDATAGAYSLQGLDDNARGDVEKFANIYIRQFWLRGIATLALDHVQKNLKQRGQFAIGSERKVGGADVHLGFEAAVPLTRGGRGLYKVTTHKDRLGYLPRPKAAELHFRSDPETHAISWTIKTPDPDPDGVETGSWRPTRLMEKVSIWLEQQQDGVSRTTVTENVTGNAKYIRAALDFLIDDEYAEETSGSRGARLVTSLKPYREPTTPSDPVPSPSENEILIPSDPVPLPTGRTGLSDGVNKTE